MTSIDPAAESFMSLVAEMEMANLCSWLSSNVSMETLLSLMPADQIPPDMLQLLSHATLSASVSSPSTISVTLQLNPLDDSNKRKEIVEYD